MIKIGLAVLLLLNITVSNAQVGIDFTSGSWKSVTEQARQENKMIFVDCYTTWCGPCKKLSKEVFPLPEVGEFFNAEFISVKIDMEKGEGIELKELFDVRAFPTLLFFDNDAKEVHRIAGYRSGENLIAEAKTAMSGQNSQYYDKAYTEGNRDKAFVLEYMTVLNAAAKRERLKIVVDEYLSSIPKNELKQQENWTIIEQYVNDGHSPHIQYIQQHKEQFAEVIEADVLEKKLYRAFTMGVSNYIGKNDDEVTIDQLGFEQYISLLEKLNVAKRAEICSNAKKRFAMVSGDWETYVSLIDDELKSLGDRQGEHMLWTYAMRVDQACDVREYRLHAAEWCQRAIEMTQSETARQSFKKTYQSLLEERKARKK